MASRFYPITRRLVLPFFGNIFFWLDTRRVQFKFNLAQFQSRLFEKHKRVVVYSFKKLKRGV